MVSSIFKKKCFFLNIKTILLYSESEYAKHKVIEKLNLVNNKNKWIKVDLCQDEEGEFSVSVQKDDDTVSNSKGLFKKRGGYLRVYIISII